jgi:NhaP-type Na+/H+ or K+/H+ antiporter
MTHGRQGSTSMRPQRPGEADASGMVAGFLLLSAIIACAAIGALIGWPLGIALPLALAGAAAGIVLGFYLVWVRWFRRR